MSLLLSGHIPKLDAGGGGGGGGGARLGYTYQLSGLLSENFDLTSAHAYRPNFSYLVVKCELLQSLSDTPSKNMLTQTRVRNKKYI